MYVKTAFRPYWSLFSVETNPFPSFRVVYSESIWFFTRINESLNSKRLFFLIHLSSRAFYLEEMASYDVIA